MARNKDKWMQKFENVRNFIKYTLQHIYSTLQYEIYSPLPSSKTAQRNWQHYTKLHNEVCNVLHNKIYWKIDFSLRFSFVKQAKNKVYILNWVLKLLVERFHWLGKHKSLYQKCKIIIVHFCYTFCCSLLHQVFLHFTWNFVVFLQEILSANKKPHVIY